MMRRLLCASAALGLASCASTSGVVGAGPDTFRVGATAITSMGGEATAKREAYKQAEAKCAADGKRADVVDQKSDAQFTGASVDVTFRCVAR